MADRTAAALSRRKGIGYKLQEISCLLLEYIYNYRKGFLEQSYPLYENQLGVLVLRVELISKGSTGCI